MITIHQVLSMNNNMEETVFYELEHNPAGSEVDEELYFFNKSLTEFFPTINTNNLLMLAPYLQNIVSRATTRGVALLDENTLLPINDVAYFELANSSGINEYRSKNGMITYTDPTHITKNRTMINRMARKDKSTIVSVNQMKAAIDGNVEAINAFITKMTKLRRRLALVKYVQLQVVQKMIDERKVPALKVLEQQDTFNKQNSAVILYTLVSALHQLIDDAGNADPVIDFIQRWVSVMAYQVDVANRGVSTQVNEIIGRNKINLSDIPAMSDEMRREMDLANWNRVFAHLNIKTAAGGDLFRRSAADGSVGSYSNLLDGMRDAFILVDDSRAGSATFDDLPELSNIIPIEQIFTTGVDRNIMSSVDMTVRMVDSHLVISKLPTVIENNNLQMMKKLVKYVGDKLEQEHLERLMNVAIDLNRSTFVNYIQRTLNYSSARAVDYLRTTAAARKQTYAEKIAGVGVNRAAALEAMRDDVDGVANPLLGDDDGDE